MSIQRLAALATGLVLVGAIAFAIINRDRSLTGLRDTTSTAMGAALPVGPPAPEFTGITGWENSPPLTLAGLRGSVVLVDFWTYSCINCQRTLPVLRDWWHTYRSQGLVIVGVHSPEFDFEKDPNNVRHAIRELNVDWPVALDPQMATWNAYQNEYWPAEYLIDKQGRIRHTHFGEGEYDVTEKAIQSLLEVSAPLAGGPAQLPGESITAEAYAGSDRYSGSIHLSGPWRQLGQYALSSGSGARAEIDFRASRVYAVAGPQGGPISVQVTLDGHSPPGSEAGSAVVLGPPGQAVVGVDRNDLYPLLSLPSIQSHSLELIAPAGLQLYTFTFG